MPNFKALFKLFLTFLRSPICVFISVKGVVVEDGKVWLRLNEIKCWELPGGRMEPHEQPAQTLTREIWEELGFKVRAGKLMTAYLTRGVWLNKALLLIYTTELISKPGEFEINGEFGKAEFKLFTAGEIRALENISDVYREAAIAVLTSSQPD